MLLPIARRLVSKPAVEPVTVAEVKSHLRVEHSRDDILIALYIAASRREAEKLSGEKFITQTWEFVYPRFPVLAEDLTPVASTSLVPAYGLTIPGGNFALQAKPVQSVSISYIDQAGVSQVFGTFSGSPLVAAEYSLLRDDNDPQIILNLNQQWPQAAGVQNAVTISTVAGYGDAASDVPELMKAGILLLCGHFYENREAVVIQNGVVTALEIPMGIRDLIAVPKVG
jgi:hypothetical protein